MRSISARIAAGANRLYPKFTFDAAGELSGAPTAPDLSAFEGGRHCTVVTYRRDGTPVATPVWFGLGEGRIYFRSLADSHKVRRLTADPRVLVAPCDRRGRPRGRPVAGHARILPADQEQVAEAAIQGNFSLGRKGYKGATAGAEARYVEVVPGR